MNTEEKAIEPFILPSDEMFSRVIVAPEEYPILVFQPRLSPQILRKHRQKFSMFTQSNITVRCYTALLTATIKRCR